MKLYPILALGALLAAGPVSAATTINVPADQSTIQGAIDAAADGDTVLVAPGTYHELIDFKGKAITVKSSGGAATTILDGNGSSPIVAFWTSEGSTSVLQGFTLTHASVDSVSAAVVVSAASPIIEDNVFVDNAQTSHAPGGSAIFAEDSSAVIVRNYFSGNQGIDSGSMVVDLLDGSPVLADNVFVNNTAVACWVQSGAAPQVYNNTMVGNTIGLEVADVATSPGAVFGNNLIAFNQVGAVYFDAAEPFTHNLVYGNTTADYEAIPDQTGTDGNISADPRLKDWGDGDVHLLSDSPAIDAGDDAFTQMSATDYYGDTRTFDGDGDGADVVDIGAAESIVPDAGMPASTVIHVPGDKATIQAAIDAAHTTYTVLVAPGTYYEQLDFEGKAITVKSSDGAATTILDGNNSGPIVWFHTGETTASVLQGFTLTHARFTGPTGFSAVALTEASATIEDDIFTDNVDTLGVGVGIAINGVSSSAVILRNYFTGNGGADLEGAFPEVISLSGASPVVADNVFVDNPAATIHDQMLPEDGGVPKIYNNTMVGNVAGLGFVALGDTSGVVLSNNLIAFNLGVGVGMSVGVNSAQPAFRDNLVYGNGTFDYSGITDPTGTDGNISAAPMLEDWADGDVHLGYGSPAIDAGDTGVSQISSTDFYGDARVATGAPHGSPVVDIGAIEFSEEPPATNDGNLATKSGVSAAGTLSATAAYMGQVLAFSTVSQPAHGAVMLGSNGQFRYTPAAGYAGSDSFTFKVTDGFGEVSNTATESVTVDDVAAKAFGSLVLARRQQVFHGSLRATAAYSGQILQYQIVAAPVHGTLTITDPTKNAYTYTPVKGYRGKDSFSFRVVDQWGTASNTALMKIDVF